MAQIAQDCTVNVPRVIEHYRRSMAPIKTMERGPDRQAAEKALAAAIGVIGRKVRPDFSEAQAQHWIASMVISLSDLAPSVATEATKAAHHKPCEFLGSAETLIRSHVEMITERHRRALRNLRELQDAIERGVKPAQPQLEDKRDDPMTQAEVDKLASYPADTTMGGVFRIGLKCGAIVQLADGSYAPATSTQGMLI